MHAWACCKVGRCRHADSRLLGTQAPRARRPGPTPPRAAHPGLDVAAVAPPRAPQDPGALVVGHPPLHDGVGAAIGAAGAGAQREGAHHAAVDRKHVLRLAKLPAAKNVVAVPCREEQNGQQQRPGVRVRPRARAGGAARPPRPQRLLRCALPAAPVIRLVMTARRRRSGVANVTFLGCTWL